MHYLQGELMNWDTIVVLVLFVIACIYCIRKLIIKKSTCSCCSNKTLCMNSHDYAKTSIQRNIKQEEGKR